MDPARWRRIEELYDAALARVGDERAAFLTAACDGDASLRRDVESLLAQNSTGFFDTSAAAQVSSSSHLASALVGGTVGPYRVISMLGAGGMGEVYLADDPTLGRKIAIKILSPVLAGDDQARKRLVREARSAAALDHPNICAIYEVGDDEGRAFIAMQYVEGETLAARLTTHPPDVAELLQIATGIADALVEAHRLGIVHRDIKPQNVMLSKRGQVKVLDFGLAKPQAAVADTAMVGSLRTETGVIAGTVPYMSPEQVRGQDVDARSDIFSFGCLVHELVNLEPPFLASNRADSITALLTKEPAPLRREGLVLPPDLQRIVDKCLEKDRERRYQTTRDLLIDLENVSRDIVGMRPARTAAAVTAAHVTRRKWLVAAALLTTVATVPITYWLRSGPAPAGDASVRSLAVLPLKALGSTDADALGLGIADTVITRVSRTGRLTVRPTSAIRKYAAADIDALAAAKQLGVDVVLDGTLQHAGDRLRVSVNLLRARDGTSIWANSFDMGQANVFDVQDQVSQAVVAALRLTLNPAERAGLVKRDTSSPIAYDYYTKAMSYFDDRQGNRDALDRSIALFKSAVDVDPSYARAHAQLGYGYAWAAVFGETRPDFIDLAKKELAIAEQLDPQLADIHVVRAFIVWSQYEGWRIEEAVREMRIAQQLDPTAGHNELAAFYFHLGLEDAWLRERERSYEQDPTSDIVQTDYVNEYFLSGRPDEGLATLKRFGRSPSDVRYLLQKRMLGEATPLVAAAVQQTVTSGTRANVALLDALTGNYQKALAAVPGIAQTQRRNRSYHHVTYTIAQIFALSGDPAGALKWLRVTVDEGFPCYTLFQRDPFLDPIRKDRGFAEFMGESKARWERYRSEFE